MAGKDVMEGCRRRWNKWNMNGMEDFFCGEFGGSGFLTPCGFDLDGNSFCRSERFIARL